MVNVSLQIRIETTELTEFLQRLETLWVSHSDCLNAGHLELADRLFKDSEALTQTFWQTPVDGVLRVTLVPSESAYALMTALEAAHV